MKFFAAMLLTLFGCAVSAADNTKRFYGYAYDLKTNQYLYTEVHAHQIENNKWLSGTMTYFAPDGSKIGFKTMDFTADPYIPVYRLDLNYNGYAEGISAVGDEIKLFKQASRDKPMETVSLGKQALMAGDSGFHSFITAHFDELMKGDSVSFKLIASGQLDAYKFRLRKIGETTFEGKPAVNIIAEPNSLLRYLVDPLTITYDPVTKKLLEYRGVSNIHDPATGKAYIARVIYPTTKPADAPKTLPPLK